MKIPKWINRKVLYVALFASLISAVVSMTLLYKTISNRKVRTSAIAEKLQTHIQKEPEKTQFNILLLGYGGAGHSGGGLSDAMVLASVNTESKNVNLIAIPRDIWIGGAKINAAFANSAGAAKKSVETVTGLPVDYYVAVDFSRFVAAVDALGGISVNVPISFTDEYYPIKGEEENLCGKSLEEVEVLKASYSGFELEKQFGCRYEELHFDAGMQQMDGASALKFIRSRHSSQHGGDFARGVRQQAVLTAVRNKLVSLNAITKIDDFFMEFSKLVMTDISEDEVVELLSHIKDPGSYTSSNINISTDNYLQNSVSVDGQYILIPKAGNENWQAIHDFVAREIH